MSTVPTTGIPATTVSPTTTSIATSTTPSIPTSTTIPSRTTTVILNTATTALTSTVTPTNTGGTIPLPTGVNTIDSGRFKLGTEGIIAIVVAGCAIIFGIIGFIVIRMRAKKKNQETLIDLQQLSLQTPKPAAANPSIVSLPPSSAVYNPKTGQNYPNNGGSQVSYPTGLSQGSSQVQYANYEATEVETIYPQYVDENGRPYTPEEIAQWQQMQQQQYVDENGRPYTQQEIDQWNAQNAQYGGGYYYQRPQ